MRIGPDGIDPLDRPGRLVLVSVSEDYDPNEDESRSEVDFGPNTVSFVDGITGYSNSVEIDDDQRRALLAHLLDAEGLPGVEEIAKLRADVDNAYSEGYEDGFAEGYDNGSEDGYERGYEQGLKDGPEPDDTALANFRQSRLHELLEAEARERGLRVLPEYKLGKQNDPEDRWWMTCILVRDKYSSIGTVRRDGHPSQYSANLDGIGTIGWYDTPEDAMEAALAEKRRRESEVSE